MGSGGMETEIWRWDPGRRGAARRVVLHESRVGWWVAQSDGSGETMECRVVWMFLEGCGVVGPARRRMDDGSVASVTFTS
jgi:hypothetical protein